MIVPEPVLGSTLTHGAQNLFDRNHYKVSKLPAGFKPSYLGTQGGSFYYFLNDMGDVYSPAAMATYLRKKIEGHPNITVRYQSDISEAKVSAARITAVKSGTDWVQAKVFIDASESGKLVRYTLRYTVGREDGKQMAATLMFQMTGIDVTLASVGGGNVRSPQGKLQFWGGYAVNTLPQFKRYAADKSHPYRIKPYNAGEESPGIYWMNMLLVYGVDAADPAAAYQKAAEEIASPAFMERLRTLPGFEKSALVLRNGKPVVGNMLYIRESIHAKKGDRYGLNKDDALYPANRYRNQAIGVAYYNFDSNSYVKGENLSNPLGKGPWYVPYAVIGGNAVGNLITPGYGASVDAFVWTAMRVYPNLIVLGDASGVAAGLALQGRFNLQNPSQTEMGILQDQLRKVQAILEK